MKTEILLVTFAVLLFTEAVLALPYVAEGEPAGDEYNDNIERLLNNNQKRSYSESLSLGRRDDYPNRLFRYGRRACVRRGDRCDHRPDDCCNNSSCRCNLWGSNCVCDRMGLFQQWGK